MMIPVFHTNSCWQNDFAEIAKILADIGYLGIELAPPTPGYPDNQWSANATAQFLKILDSNALDLTSIDLRNFLTSDDFEQELSLTAPDQNERDGLIRLICRTIEFASDMGIPIICFPTGRSNLLIPRDKSLELLIECLEICLEAAEEHDVVLAIEPTPGNLIRSYMDFCELHAIFEGSSLGLCYNIANGHAGFEDIPAILRDAPDLYHIHFADAANRLPRHLIPGSGVLNLGLILSALKQRSYQNGLSIKLERDICSEDAARRAFKAIYTSQNHTSEYALVTSH